MVLLMLLRGSRRLIFLFMGLCGGSLLISLAGCTVGPDFRKPKPEVPQQWSESAAVPADTAMMDLARWWTVLDDPRLETLVNRALEANKDLRLAAARAREARAQRGVASSDAWPNVDTAASYTRSRRSESTASGGGAAVADESLFMAGFDSGWELDIFGGVRRAVQAADADVAAAEDNLRDVMVVLLGDVARNYIEMRGSQQRVAIALANIEAQRRTVEMTRGRFEVGLSTDLEVAQAEAQLAITEARVPELEASVKLAMHRLGVLTGREPGALVQELSDPSPIPAVPPAVPVGLPSDLLRRRPDIRRAEHQLEAATARIGVATADLFPRFSLTGSLGLQSANITDLPMAGSRLYSLGPGIQWPLFNAGRIRANIEVQNARQEQALATYEKTVLTALEEVESALVAFTRQQAAGQSLEHAVQATRRAAEAAEELYTGGLTDFLNVLETQRSVYQAQDQLALSDQAVATSLVSLFKALGGGW